MTASDSTVTGASSPSPEHRRTTERLRLQDGARQLLQAFSRTASSALNLPAGLAVLCHDAVPTFGVARASAWLHDRHAQELVLAASSGAAASIEGARLRADSAQLPAPALRDERGRVWPAVASSDQARITIPLRGRRRALGVLLLEGVPPWAANATHYLDELQELGRQLSAGIENLLLLEDVLRSRRELAHTFDSLEDVVAICDGQRRVVHVNRTLSDRLALPRERMIGRPLGDLLGAEAAAWVGSVERSDAMHAPTEACELDDAALGGRFTMTLTPLPGPDGRPGGMVFVGRDITTQARLEAERAALRERLTQSEKLAALGQFIAGIAHELNNPLQAVLGHLELLRRQGRVPTGIRREVGLVVREADRAARIVDNLLVFAGGRPATHRPLDLNTLVTQTLALRAPACRAAGIEVVRRLDERQPRVSGGRLMLQQALFNLLLNAEQELAPRGGGRIEVCTQLTADGAAVRLEVHDTGPGIRADVLPRLFEPFFTTKEVGRGTGLGLAITYGVVKDHRGVLSAGNHPAGGAVFTIELPTIGPRRTRRPGPRATGPAGDALNSRRHSEAPRSR
jgi:C4-dicarboxylate-specific signal transduction histidine kinase